MNLRASTLARRCLLAGLVPWCGIAAAAAQTAPLRVTTDSAEYCATLSDQVRQIRRARQPGPVPWEVRELTHEGRRMCNEGHIRPGILRLRRALQMLRGE
jgi:hypothetical protein